MGGHRAVAATLIALLLQLASPACAYQNNYQITAGVEGRQFYKGREETPADDSLVVQLYKPTPIFGGNSFSLLFDRERFPDLESLYRRLEPGYGLSVEVANGNPLIALKINGVQSPNEYSETFSRIREIRRVEYIPAGISGAFGLLILVYAMKNSLRDHLKKIRSQRFENE